MTPETPTTVIRSVRPADFEALYAFAKTIPELRVSASFEFMDPDEFKLAMEASDGVFLCAEADGRPVGFVYANADDPEKRGSEKRWACLVYLAVDLAFRGRGIASTLYARCVEQLRGRGVTHLYGWANVESGSIVEFMKKRGFAAGHRYMWMDKKL